GGGVWESGSYTWAGTPNISLGLKGMLSVELVARGANRDLHSSMAAYVPSPVWRLVWALSAIKSHNDRIHIPGFYDDIRVPTEAQARMIDSIPDDTARERANLGIPAFINGMEGSEVYRASSFSPTANILGIEAGYNGPARKRCCPKKLVPSWTSA